MRVRVVPVSPEAPENRALAVPVVRATTRPARVLDFDIETIAAGFADPEWVPQKITCCAWSWLGQERVWSTTCGPRGIFGNPDARATMLEPLLHAIAMADMVTGHNINRFDLPVINAEAMRLGLPIIRSVKTHDTIRVARSKGFKKGQDTLGVLFGTTERKMVLSWQEWQDGYDDATWQTIRERCESDVRQHKSLYAIMAGEEEDMLRPPIIWRSGT